MGHHNRHFAGDRFAAAGAWGTPNSGANFCEEDYAVTIYVAEFINALTNVGYVYYALRSIFRPSRTSPRRAKISSPRLDFMSLSLLAVGMASFVYHSTLRQTCQYIDDLSMLALATSMLQYLYTARQSPQVASIVTIALSIAVYFVSNFYVRTGNILFHFLSFSTMLVLAAARMVALIATMKGKDRQERKAMFMRRFWSAVTLLGVAFALWNIDLELCHELRVLREKLGLPWAWAFELHGWWHILTALGASDYMDLIRDVCDE